MSEGRPGKLGREPGSLRILFPHTTANSNTIGGGVLKHIDDHDGRAMLR